MASMCHMTTMRTGTWVVTTHNSSKYQLWFIRYKSFDSIQITSILPVKNNAQLHVFHYNFHYIYTLLLSETIM